MNKISAIIILYNPNIGFVTNLVNRLINEVAAVILVDNSEIEISQKLDCEEREYVHYIHNKNIGGIAGAHNRGIDKALSIGCDGVILFDQDSNPESGLVDSLIIDYKKVRDSGYKIAAIGPTPVNVQTNEEYKPRIDRRKSFEYVSDVIKETQLISSGKLISKEVLLEVGGMEEKLFIDGVDSEWCWRARKLGYEIGMSRNTRMLHMLGEGDRIFLGVPIATTSSFRLYYQFRNYVLFLSRSYVPFYWKLVNGVKYSVKLFYYGLLVNPQRQNIQNMLRGIKDGIRNI